MSRISGGLRSSSHGLSVLSEFVSCVIGLRD